MLWPTRTDWRNSAVGTVLAFAAFVVYTLLRNRLAGSSVVLHWDQLLLMAILVGAGILVTLQLMRRHQHRLLQQFARQIRSFRNNPAPHAGNLRDQPSPPDFAPLIAALEVLFESYRKSLSDRVTQNEALESLRSLLGRIDLERGQGPALSHRGNTTSRDMVARFTPNMHWLTATPTLQQFLGHAMSDLNGRPFADVVHPGDLESLQRAFGQAVQEGEAHNIQFRLSIRRLEETGISATPGRSAQRQMTAVPEERHVQVDMLTRYNELGIPLHVRCYLVDITDRIRAERELLRRTHELSRTNERLRRMNQDLQRLKESYRDLYHNAPVMYFSLDLNANFVTFNDTTLTTLGYTREDLFKRPYTRLLTPSSQRHFLQNRNAYQNPTEVETQWVKKDGTVIDVWIRSSPLYDETGRFVRSRSVAQDVTERNRLADELRQRGDALERAIAELRQINNALDEFTAVVSHDLKEPLRTMKAYSRFLAEQYADQLGPEGASYIDQLSQASQRMENLIKDLLTLAHAGEILSDPQTFDMTATLAMVCQDLDDLVQRKRAFVVLAGTLPTVAGDSQRVTQLLSNLISNGIKYNDSATPRVVIGWLAPSEPAVPSPETELVTFYVTDNGIGIDPGFHDQLFKLFRRGSNSDRYEGTGAGLAIAKKIVEAHGGRIWLESQPGQGSTFYFTLPCGQRPAEFSQVQRVLAGPRLLPRESGPVIQPRPEMESESTETLPDLDMPEVSAVEPPAAPRILLVEDMAEIALIARRLAQRAGYHMDWVTSAEAAWDHLHQHEPWPDLLLLDVHLPGMSGIELCKKLRQLPDLSHLTIALFSQLEAHEVASEDENAGADFILSKDLLCQAAAWQNKMDEILAVTRS